MIVAIPPVAASEILIFIPGTRATDSLEEWLRLTGISILVWVASSDPRQTGQRAPARSKDSRCPQGCFGRSFVNRPLTWVGLGVLNSMLVPIHPLISCATLLACT